ncbi:NADH dehydrogenase [ubiquinone] 1 alpha subcomplex assembly factor 6 [Paragonimus westermani]|uniref:NADH dehydrogenase [ubiquinone] 1 alpha subcomplex assembly factor 6 n=1 Tax=Paragonimus westermani TaxID=34504 RepID=A0A5J4NRT8_9TREM|nr:NADH dehydrogenase [ubiquinone] 1 alpha subcomplex assembly factor 6 [Paragonimus westermani]
MVGLRLSKFYFLQLINARQRHFNECSFSTLESAQTYAEETNTSVHYLISEAYGIRSIDVDHSLNHLGRAQGLIALIRGAVPLARSRRVILLPLDLLDKHCTNQERLLRLLRAEPLSGSSNEDQSLCDFFYDLACIAREQAVTAVRLATNLLNQPRSQRNTTDDRSSSELNLTRLLLPRFMLPLIPCLDYLTRLERIGHFDPRRVVGRDSNPLLPLRLVWTSWRGLIPRG